VVIVPDCPVLTVDPVDLAGSAVVLELTPVVKVGVPVVRRGDAVGITGLATVVIGPPAGVGFKDSELLSACVSMYSSPPRFSDPIANDLGYPETSLLE